MAMCKCKKSNPRNPRPCGCMSNPRKRRNPDIEYGSDDYRIGLFQGAVEKGKAPPPPSTSKELRSGYTAGARVAKAKPAALQRALGVYSVTRDHARAGDELRDVALGGSTTANPRRNPAAKGYVKIAAHEDKKRKKPTVRDAVYFEAAGPFVRSKLLKAGETLEKVKDDADTITHLPTGVAIYSGVLSRYENSKKLVVAAMRDLRQWIKKLSKDELRTISEGFTFGSRKMTPAQEKLLREAYQVCRSGRIERNPRRNPLSADLKGLPKDRLRKLGAVASYGRSFSTAGKKYTVEGVKVSPYEAEAYLKIYAQVGDKGKQKLRSMPLRDALDVCYSAVLRRSTPFGMSKTRNPMSAAERKHLAHEKDEEKTFAAMMAKLPVGVTLKAGKHRVRKLSKGYVVVDGERLTEKQAAAKIHRGK